MQSSDAFQAQIFKAIEKAGATPVDLPPPIPPSAVPLPTYLRENDKRGEAEGKLAVSCNAVSGLLWHLNLIAQQCPDTLTRLRARCVVEAHRPGTYPHAFGDYDELLETIGLSTGRAA